MLQDARNAKPPLTLVKNAYRGISSMTLNVNLATNLAKIVRPQPSIAELAEKGITMTEKNAQSVKNLAWLAVILLRIAQHVIYWIIII